MNLVEVACPICAKRTANGTFAAACHRRAEEGFTFPIVRCAGCGLWRTSPRPSEGDMADFYAGSNYQSPAHGWTAVLNRRIAANSVGFTQGHSRGTRLLDIGCGTGEFLMQAAARGYDTHGLEPYQRSFDGFPAVLRPRIRVGSIQTAEFPANSFDVITLWNVLEHLPAPVDSLRSIASWLRPGGTLIIEVPNKESLESRLTGRHWLNLDVPYHFWHFAPKTLEQLIREAGFSDIRIFTSAFLQPVLLFNLLFGGSRSFALKFRESMGHALPSPLLQGMGLITCMATRILGAGSIPTMRLTAQRAPVVTSPPLPP